MRLHISAAMSATSRHGQTALVAVEHLRVAPEVPGAMMTWQQRVVHVEQVPATVEAAAARLREMASEVAAEAPTIIVDTGAGAGRALYAVLRTYRGQTTWPPGVHMPSAYDVQGHARQELLDAVLHAYALETIRFDPSLRENFDRLSRALALHKATVAEDGLTTTSSDEALVVALGLSLRFGRYFGGLPRFVERDGAVKKSVYASDDTYLSRVGTR